VLDVAAILKLTPLAAGALKSYRRGDPAKNLDRAVRADLENDRDLGPGVTDSLITQWLHVHNDSRAAVIIAGLLDHGDLAWLDALRIRMAELLHGLETLPWEVPAVVDRLTAAVAENFVAAQTNASEATQTSTNAVLSALSPLATSSELGEVSQQVELLARMLTPPPPPRVLILAASFDEAQQRHLTELIAEDSAAGAQLGEVLAARGINGVADLVTNPPGWAEDQPAVFWRGVGRLLGEALRFNLAYRAFVKEAESPDVSDRARALINAAGCAAADANHQQVDELFGQAASCDAEHPSSCCSTPAASRTPSSDSARPRPSTQSPTHSTRASTANGRSRCSNCSGSPRHMKRHWPANKRSRTAADERSRRWRRSSAPTTNSRHATATTVR